MKLIQELVRRGVLDKVKAVTLSFEVKKLGLTEEEIILAKKIVPEVFLFKLKSEVIKIPFKKIVPKEIPLQVLQLISEEPAINYKMIPLAKKGDTVEIGMIYPEDIHSQSALRFLGRQGKFRYKVFLITFTDFNKLLKQYRTLKREAKIALTELEKTEEKVPLAGKKTVTEVIIEEAPVIKMVSVILKHAVEGKASDIHIEPAKDKLKVRFRADGILYPSLFLPLKVHTSIVARVKILANMKIDETRIPQDGRFSVRIADRDIDFRVSTFPTLLGEKVAIRVLDPIEGLKTYTELGLIERNLKVVEEAIKKPYGLILVTGPTGCGKTTTLYAILKTLNKEEVNIVTLEDPIEYSIMGVNQSQVRPKIGYEFARGLRHILRQDPDIIMVGEVRDEETANLVIHAALTGHIVLSSLHTNNAVGAIFRLIDMGIKPFLIPSTLNIIISQRLIRVLCPYCKEELKPSEKIKDYILEKIKNLPPFLKKEIKVQKNLSIFKAKGCRKCNFKGYLGRTGLFEILTMTDALAKVILERPVESSIFKEARRQGMLTMEQDGILKVLKGETTIEEIIRVAEEI